AAGRTPRCTFSHARFWQASQRDAGPPDVEQHRSAPSTPWGALLGRRAQLPAERGHERPAIYAGIVVGTDEHRVVVGSVEREGPNETGVAQQLDALDDVEPHADPVAVVPEAR